MTNFEKTARKKSKTTTAAASSAAQTRVPSPRWTAHADKELAQRFLQAGEEQSWPVWQKHLRRRKDPFTGTGLESFKTDEALRWGLSEQQIANLFHQPEHVNGNSRNGEPLVKPLAHLSNASDEPRALHCLELAYNLPRLAGELEGRAWWDTLSQLVEIANSASALDVARHPLVHQWLAGELPLALVVLFPELAACQELLTQARHALAIGVEELLDGEGLPHGRHVALQAALAACWTRSSMLGSSLEGGYWPEDAAAQFPYVVRELLRLARTDGSSIFTKESIKSTVPQATRQFFRAAAKQAGGKQTRRLANAICQKTDSRKKKRRRPKLPSANHSEWAQIAVLRPSWKRSAPQLAVAYNNSAPRIELVIGRTRLFSGDWQFESRAAGKQAQPLGDWEEICWVSDDDVDYLEIEMELGEGLKLQRQVCLARKDRFLFVADAVLGNSSQSIQHRMQLPVVSDAKAAGAADSREVTLQAHNREAVILPLALPEWRIEQRGGELITTANLLELRQEIGSGNLYTPLWIDLEPKRHARPFTWRQLTVAEQRQNVSPDAAVGFRVQFGEKQWLIYRSLTKPRNRTVLGHNLATDFLIARFGRDGSVKSLVEVE